MARFKAGAWRCAPAASILLVAFASPPTPFPCIGPGNPSCIGATGPCGAAHPEPGCADPCCCSAVCEVDALCCVTTWTVRCAETAIDLGCGGTPPFLSPFEFLAADEPVIHAVADLDGNGTSDTAVVMPDDSPQVAGRMQVFRNLGDLLGVWQGLASNPPVTVGHEPSAVAAGLFNNDAHVDLAITNAGDDNVSIYLNQGLGTGTFVLFTQVPVGDRPSAVVAADFNEDLKTDLAVTNESDGTLVILLGDGNGNFAPALGAAPINVSAHPIAMTNGDFDGNKCPDLAGGGQAGLSAVSGGGGGGEAFVLLGQPGGGFLGPFFFAAGADPHDLATGDLDGNGLNDVVVANRGDGTLSILLNQGGGVFASALSVPVGAQPLSVDTFDLDGALGPDLAVVAEVGGTRLVQVLQHPPSGPFSVTYAVNVGADANFVVRGLFNGDALDDLVTVNADDGPTGGSVTVLLGGAPAQATCAWDCAAPGDGSVGVPDLLALLGQWGQTGTPCDFDSNGAGTPDLLAMLAHWGACP